MKRKNHLEFKDMLKEMIIAELMLYLKREPLINFTIPYNGVLWGVEFNEDCIKLIGEAHNQLSHELEAMGFDVVDVNEFYGIFKNTREILKELSFANLAIIYDSIVQIA